MSTRVSLSGETPASDQRIVISGIGLMTALGAGREPTWNHLLQGRTGIRWLPETSRRFHPQARGNLIKLAGAPAAECGAGLDPGLDPVTRLALSAALEAVADARLDLTNLDRNRIGCVLGTSKGCVSSLSRAFANNRTQPAPPDSRKWLEVWPDAPASAVAQHLDLRGAALCPMAACATGLLSMLKGVELISGGYCDIVLAGSADASLQEILLASYRRLGVLAKGFDDPAVACRPFDRLRNGFLVGEGAAVLVLERTESAAHRGVRPYAEWVCGGMATDLSGLTRVEAAPVGLTRLITDVLRRAQLAPDEIDYVNLHGTATLDNDVCETRALKRALGTAARKIPCSGLKGSLGHLLGAAGSVELALTILAMRDGTVPPTINLTHPDQDCDLDYTPLIARPRPIETALKLSLGFGGHLVAGIVRRFS